MKNRETTELRRARELSEEYDVLERQLEAKRRRRDEWIVRCIEVGHSQREIGEATGLSHGRIGQIGKGA